MQNEYFHATHTQLMDVDQWKIMNSRECENASCVVVDDGRVPKSLSDDVAGTLYDPKMGPRFEGDRCATCDGSYETCKLGHFGIIRLTSRIFVAKLTPYVVHAIRSVCRICNTCESSICSDAKTKCKPYTHVKDRQNGYITVESAKWDAEKTYAFLSAVPDLDKAVLNLIFDNIMVLPNPHRPIHVSKSVVTRKHRYTDAYAKIIRVSKTRSTRTEFERGLTETDMYSAVNELLLSTKASTYGGGDEDALGILSCITRKNGLIRNNLMGKRVDFSARAVAVGDPTLRVDQFGIPRVWAEKLTIPIRVQAYNIDACREIVRSGKWTTTIRAGLRFDVDICPQKDALAKCLGFGDVVERWLENGDPIMLIRQPTLHKGSMMVGFVKLHDRNTIELNVNACTPFNGDFDGDEYNAFVPRSEKARVEFLELFALKGQIVDENGNCQIFAMQNAALGMYKSDADIPHLQGVARVTESIARERIRQIWFDDGHEAAVYAISDMSNAGNDWLDKNGASVGLNEFDSVDFSKPKPSDGALLRARKKELAVVTEHLMDETYDESKAFNEAVVFAGGHEPYDRGLRDMRLSGCKGNATNELNVALVLGKQFVCDAAPRPFFGDRVLPCELKTGRGFIPVGYVRGLRPEHTALQQMSGRYGVYTKSVGVKESGRRFREMCQCLENVVVRENGLVCDEVGRVVQLLYGDDGLDPKLIRRETRLPVGKGVYHGEFVDIPSDVLESSDRAKAFFAGQYRVPRGVIDVWNAAKVPAGHAVGILASQSISEPATQETLNKFHFAGQKASRPSNLNRLFHASRGIVYGSCTIPPPLTVESYVITFARPDAGEWGKRFERFQSFPPAEAYLVLNFSEGTDPMRVFPALGDSSFRSSHPALDDGMCRVHVGISRDGAKETAQDIMKRYESCVRGLRVTGSAFQCEGDFKTVLSSAWADPMRTYTDDAKAMCRVLGIEAARAMLMREFNKAFVNKVDVRHVALVVDAMTYTGLVCALSFSGFKSGLSVLGQACFERSLQVFIDAAVKGVSDGGTRNVSSSVLTGTVCDLGTGSVTLIMDVDAMLAEPHVAVYDPLMPYELFKAPVYDPLMPYELTIAAPTPTKVVHDNPFAPTLTRVVCDNPFAPLAHMGQSYRVDRPSMEDEEYIASEDYEPVYTPSEYVLPIVKRLKS